jgi:hypothetical protein
MILGSLRVKVGTKRIGEWLFVVSSDDVACERSRRGIIEIPSPSRYLSKIVGSKLDTCKVEEKKRVGIAGERDVLHHVMQPQQNNLGTKQEIQKIIVQLKVIKTQMKLRILIKGLV